MLIGQHIIRHGALPADAIIAIAFSFTLPCIRSQKETPLFCYLRGLLEVGSYQGVFEYLVHVGDVTTLHADKISYFINHVPCSRICYACDFEARLPCGMPRPEAVRQQLHPLFCLLHCSLLQCRANAGRLSRALGRQGDVSAPMFQTPCWRRLFANEAVEGPPAAKDPESARGFETQGPSTEQGRNIKEMEENFEGWR